MRSHRQFFFSFQNAILDGLIFGSVGISEGDSQHSRKFREEAVGPRECHFGIFLRKSGNKGSYGLTVMGIQIYNSSERYILWDFIVNHAAPYS